MKTLRSSILPFLCCLSSIAIGIALEGVVADKRVEECRLEHAKELKAVLDKHAKLVCQVDELREAQTQSMEVRAAMKREFDEQMAATLWAQVEREARVVELPEDGEKWSLTLFLDPKWQTLPNPKLRKAQVDAHAMWQTEPWLVQLRRETHSQIMLIDDPRSKVLHPVIQTTPCLLLQRANGEVIWKESGGQLSQGPNGLRHALQKATKKHCPDGRCPVTLPVVGTPPATVPPASEVPAVIAGETATAPADDKKKASPALGVAALLGCSVIAYGARFAIASR